MSVEFSGIYVTSGEQFSSIVASRKRKRDAETEQGKEGVIGWDALDRARRAADSEDQRKERLSKMKRAGDL